MRIVGGYQAGRSQKRILLVEPGDVGHTFALYAEIEGDQGEEGIDLHFEKPNQDFRAPYPSKVLDDPVARDEPIAQAGVPLPLGKDEMILERVRGRLPQPPEARSQVDAPVRSQPPIDNRSGSQRYDGRSYFHDE